MSSAALAFSMPRFACLHKMQHPRLAGRRGRFRRNERGERPEERAAESYGDATAAIVRLLQERFGLRVSGAADAETRALILRLAGADAGRRVEGTVRDALGRPLADAAVVLSLVTVAGPKPLAEVQSDAAGRFVVRYELPADAGRANLQLSGLAGRLKLRSPVLFNAPRVVTGFDLIAETTAAADPPRFTRESERLKPALRAAGMDLAKVSETPEAPGASLIGDAAGLAPVRVALLAAAYRIEADSGNQIPAELGYALGSQGMGFGPASLAATPTCAADVWRGR